jgi:cell wall-associated NlpC family hydrolase
MSAPPAENGDIPIFRGRGAEGQGMSAGDPAAKNRNVPIFGELPTLLLVWWLLAGCASTPIPYNPAKLPPQATRPQSQQSADGAGGATAMRNRGEDLADYALTLRGTPYRFGGSTRTGFDCSGLVFYAHRQLGLTVPRTSRDQAEQAEEVKQRKLQPGDLVFFRIGSRRVNHVGIYIGDKQFVHAPGAGKPVTINSLDDEFYADRFESAGRYWSRPPR